MRLNKFIAHNTTYSRREADKLIFDGKVKIDKKVVDNPAIDVTAQMHVSVNDKPVREKTMFTVAVYNKPKGELVTKNDPRGRKIIYDSLPAKFKHFIPVGRLDFATEGVLLLTDSSKVATALMTSGLERVYNVKIKGLVTDPMIEAMENGLELDDASAGAHEKSDITSMSFAPFFAYQVKKSSAIYSTLKIAISEGKNREVRRFFAHFGAEVADLKRVNFGGVELNNLPTGKTRYLTKKEYEDLRKFLYNLEKTSKK